MGGALTKSIGELTSQDVNELISLGVQEGDTVEFKESLSSNDHKKAVIKEVVAFANGYGGRIFIGIAERSGNPSVAAEVKAVPDCANLADQIGRACADLVDPPVLRLDVSGIATDQDGSGVIVIDVPRSIRAPHMSKRNYRAYRRRGSESVPMDMRDIQDMTLRSASRFSEIEAEFGRRRQDFDAWTEKFQSENEESGYCLRLSFVPLDDVDIGRVHLKQDVVPQFVGMKGHLRLERLSDVSLLLPRPFRQFRPVVRGTCLEGKIPYSGVWFAAQIWEHGGLEIWFGYGEKHGSNLVLFSAWLGYLVANGLRNVERVRRYAELPLLSYGLETQLTVQGQPMILRGFDDTHFLGYEAQLPVGEHVMPRSEVGSVDCFDGLITQHFTDWFNLAGEEWDAEISVDYRLD